MMLYTTTKDKTEAEKIGRQLVEEQLATCVNFWDGVSSIYWWKGEIEEAEEAFLIVKCDEATKEKTIARIKELHSYESPSIIEL